MATNLLDAGYEVIVFDIDRDRIETMVNRGAIQADSPAAVASQAEIVLSSLPTADAIESAYLGSSGMIEGVSADSLLIELSTTKPSTTETVNEAIVEAGAVLIDAPVIGVPPVAERAELTLMVGGPQEAFDRAKPVLEFLGETIYHVGSVGDGHRTKLINNALMLTNYAIAAEVLALAEVVGIDPQPETTADRRQRMREKFDRLSKRLPREDDDTTEE
jgi:3-hydroxyisobutyrate dehydrogenase-like beta-hydroxyacid dehydrogenase